MSAQILERHRRTLKPSDSIGTIEVPQEEAEIEHQVCHVLVRTRDGEVADPPRARCGATLQREKDAHDIRQCFRANHDLCHICLAKITRKPGSPPPPPDAKLPQRSR
jgi:hypothetical protein